MGEGPAWDHRIFRVFEGDMNPDNGFFDLNSERTSHVFIDDLPEVFDELFYFGWEFNFGFTLDNHSFYLMYKKAVPPKDRTK